MWLRPGVPVRILPQREGRERWWDFRQHGIVSGNPQEAVPQNSISPVAELNVDESLPGVQARESPQLLIDSLYELFCLYQSHVAFIRIRFKIQHEQVVGSGIYCVEEVVHLALYVSAHSKVIGSPHKTSRESLGPALFVIAIDEGASFRRLVNNAEDPGSLRRFEARYCVVV